MKGIASKEYNCKYLKIPALKKLYKTEKTPICVVGKVLKNKEMEDQAFVDLFMWF